MRHLLLIFCLFPFAALASTQDAAKCPSIENPEERLACFDAAFAPAATAPAVATIATGKWQTRLDKSDFEDTTDVYLSLLSSEPVQCRQYGSKQPVRLFLRCKENTTSVFFTGDCHLASGFEGYGRVDVRIDDNAAFEVNMSDSTDNSALGFWRGNRAIPFVKRLIGSDRVLLRFTPFSMSPVTAEFQTTGLDQAIAPLRRSCGW